MKEVNCLPPKSSYEKRKTTVIFLNEINLGNSPKTGLNQTTNLKKHGYILIYPGKNYELTAKGRALASLFSDDEDEFRKNVQASLAPKEQKLSPGTMPLFYKKCKECKEQEKIFKEWVKEDIQAISDRTTRPEVPLLRKHSHPDILPKSQN